VPIALTHCTVAVVVVQNSQGVFGNGSSGFLGLGRSAGNGSYFSGILNSRGWSDVLFGLSLNNYVASSANATTTQSAGSFNVRELNTDLFTGQIYWQSIAQISDVPANMPADWAIKFDSYRIMFDSKATSSSGGVAIIEPYFPEVRIPGSEARDFCSSISAESNCILTILS
jgi:hypothetical protein